ncbi:MAG: hypothetical protein GYA16_07155 [Spirochaetes bacterium]|nr:hypothetical protein [Spirochaetota bacterium]NMB64632.1 hypothetical protein [Spirochaetota bacterium]
MIEKLRTALMESSLSREELQHIMFLLFCCGDSNRQVPEDLIKAGYISINDNCCTLTDKGRAYRDSLLQKLAKFVAASDEVFRQYFDNELLPIKKKLQLLKHEWRSTRDKRLRYKETLMKQGKDKAAIKKDVQYKKLQREQDTLRTRMRHAEKEYNKKLSACIKRIGILDL